MKIRQFPSSIPPRGIWLCGLAAAIAAPTLPAEEAAGTATLPPINSPASGERHSGKFIWADLFTAKPETSKRFYTKMFGWKAEDLRIGEHDCSVFRVNGRPVAAMVRRDRVKGETGDSIWVPYFSTTSVSRVARKVDRAGGKRLAEPRKLAERGVHGIFRDSEGAIFGALDSASGDTPDFLPEPGEWIWTQLMVRRIEPSLQFYRSFGIKTERNGEIRNRESHLLVSDGFARAGVTAADDGDAVGWLPFLRVDKIGSAVSRTRQLGGKVLVAPDPKVGDGMLAVILDPAGARIGLMEWPATQEDAR